ncbi:MAG: hypothetical protein ACRCTQ_07000 [Brevinemataceae bacterium]
MLRIKNSWLNCLILLVLTLGITYLLRFDIYEHDDFWQSFAYTDNLWDIITSADHGRYFSWLYMKLIVHGSSLLFHLHPNDNLFIKFIVGINISIVVLFVSYFLTKPFKQKLSPIWLLSTVFMLLFLYTNSLAQIYRYNQHFAYQTSFFFFLFAWIVTARYFIQGEFPLHKHLVRNSLLALFLGLSAHFNILTSIAMVLFLFIYAVIRFYLQDKSFKHILIQLKNLGIGVYVPLTSFLIGIVLYFSAPNFQYLLALRSTNKDNRIIESLKQLPNFLPEWFGVVFLTRNAYLLIGFFILCCLYITYLINAKLIKNKNQAIRVLVFASSLILGVAFFNGTLLINGRSMYNTNMYWIHHGDLILITRIIELIALWVVVGYISSLNTLNIKALFKFDFHRFTIKTTIKLYWIVCVVSLLLFLTVIVHYINLYDSLKAERSNWYQTEKIYRFYSLLGQTAILPANQDKGMGEFWHNQLYLSTPENPIDWTGCAYFLKNYPTVYYGDILYAKTSVYTDDDPSRAKYYVSYILTNSNAALQMFQEKGGVITEQELDYPLFNKLFDEKFILNKRSTND